MVTLVRMLPFLIGELIDDEDDHWSCFFSCGIFAVSPQHLRWPKTMLLSWRGSSRLTSKASQACILSPWYQRCIILSIFQSKCWGMYMCMCVCQTRTCECGWVTYVLWFRFGPLRYTWCMRFESKNKQIKEFTSGCFKNVPLSIAQRHQQMMAYLLAVKRGKSRCLQ